MFYLESEAVKKWDLNEVLMLVDCYNRIAEKKSDSTPSCLLESYFDVEARKLSAVLRRREIEQQGKIDDRFRNVPGIKMKLRNIEFLATAGKSGLYNYSAMDKKGYELYKSDPELFSELVAALKVAYKAENIDDECFDTSDAGLNGPPEEIFQEDKETQESSLPQDDSEEIMTVMPEQEPASSLADAADILPEDIPYYETFNLRPDAYSDVSIDDVQFSVRVSNCLHREGIKNIAALLNKTPSQLCKIKNFGRKCSKEIEAYISELTSDHLTYSDEYTEKIAFRSNLDFKKYKDEILLGDFSFADSLELDDNDKAQLARYQEAFDCLGEELAFECFSNPEYISEVSKALGDFYVEYKLSSQRRKALLDLVDLLPDRRAELDAYNFILAFSRDPEKRKILLSLCPTSGKSIRSLVNTAPLTDIIEFSLLEKFISWCNFDISIDLDKLYEKLFKQPRDRSILDMRAANKTLEATGNAHGVTRERIRQLEMKAKRIFTTWHRRSRIIFKIAALAQGNAALTPVELEEYFGENTNILIFLLKSVGGSGFCYDEQTDAFYIGDENFSDRLQNALDELPIVITKSDFSEIVREASEASDIPKNVIEKAIIDGYRLTGDTFHRSSLTLRMVYESILEKYYPDGIFVYNDAELARFRELVRNNYGDINLPENNRAISVRLAALCILCGRGKYKLRNAKLIPKELEDKIYRFIKDSPYSAIMTNTIFSLFEDELRACGIDNKYYLQGSLKESFGEQFIFRRDYISKDYSTNMYMDIVKFIKKSSYPLSRAEISKEFPGVSDIVISIALKDPDIINFFGAYLHSSNLKITLPEKNYLSNVLIRALADGSAHHGKDIYEIVIKEQPDLLQRHGLYSAFSLFSVLAYLFEDHYEFDRPYLASQGVTIDKAGDRLKEMVLDADEIAIADISSYAKEIRYTIYSLLDFVSSFSDTHLMRNYEVLTTISLLGVNAKIAKTVENLISEEIVGPTPITHLQCTYRLPMINVPWNEWLIYSVLKKWSTTLDTGTSSPQYRSAVPIVGPKGSITKEALDSFSGLQQDTFLQPDNLDNIDDLIADVILDE